MAEGEVHVRSTSQKYCDTAKNCCLLEKENNCLWTFFVFFFDSLILQPSRNSIQNGIKIKIINIFEIYVSMLIVDFMECQVDKEEVFTNNKGNCKMKVNN